MQHILIFLLGLTLAFAQNERVAFPNNIKSAHFEYEGTLSARDKELPITGEFWLNSDESVVRILDSMEVDYQGKTWNVRHLSLINVDDKIQHDFLVVNDKCIESEYSQDERTFPRVSAWRKLAGNKFERIITNKGSLNRVLKLKAASLGSAARETHDIKVKYIVTLQKQKLTDFEIIITVDGEELVRKVGTVTRHIEGKVSNNVFRVPASCKQTSRAAQRRVLSISAFLLGIDMDVSHSQEGQFEGIEGRMGGRPMESEESGENAFDEKLKNKKHGKKQMEDEEESELPTAQVHENIDEVRGEEALTKNVKNKQHGEEQIQNEENEENEEGKEGSEGEEGSENKGKMESVRQAGRRILGKEQRQ